jgi:hypothetical protein
MREWTLEKIDQSQRRKSLVIIRNQNLYAISNKQKVHNNKAKEEGLFNKINTPECTHRSY